MTAANRGIAHVIAGRNITLSFFKTKDSPPISPDDITWQFRSSFYNTVLNITEASHSRYTFHEDKLSLTISGVRPGDEGTYTLLATNVIGNGFDFIELTVFGKLPQINSFTIVFVLHISSYYTVVEPSIEEEGGDVYSHLSGETASFACTVNGVPLAGVVWLRDGLILQAHLSDRFQVTEETVPSSQYEVLEARRSNLTITDLKQRDSGTYLCKGFNGIEGPAVQSQPYHLVVTTGITIT